MSAGKEELQGKLRCRHAGQLCGCLVQQLVPGSAADLRGAAALLRRRHTPHCGQRTESQRGQRVAYALRSALQEVALREGGQG